MSGNTKHAPVVLDRPPASTHRASDTALVEPAPFHRHRSRGHRPRAVNVAEVVFLALLVCPLLLILLAVVAETLRGPGGAAFLAIAAAIIAIPYLRQRHLHGYRAPHTSRVMRATGNSAESMHDAPGRHAPDIQHARLHQRRTT
jgi:hypothetical protein